MFDEPGSFALWEGGALYRTGAALGLPPGALDLPEQSLERRRLRLRRCNPARNSSDRLWIAHPQQIPIASRQAALPNRLWFIDVRRSTPSALEQTLIRPIAEARAASIQLGKQPGTCGPLAMTRGGLSELID
jgi:hypothetical protein